MKNILKNNFYASIALASLLAGAAHATEVPASSAVLTTSMIVGITCVEGKVIDYRSPNAGRGIAAGFMIESPIFQDSNASELNVISNYDTHVDTDGSLIALNGNTVELRQEDHSAFVPVGHIDPNLVTAGCQNAYAQLLKTCQGRSLDCLTFDEVLWQTEGLEIRVPVTLDPGVDFKISRETSRCKKPSAEIGRAKTRTQNYEVQFQTPSATLDFTPIHRKIGFANGSECRRWKSVWDKE